MEIPRPTEWEGRAVDTIDALLHIKQQLEIGRPLWLFTGGSGAESLVSFIQGFQSCCSFNRLPTDRYRRFMDWLREVKRELPGEGWVALYLRQHGGDHHAAVMWFLSNVAEFAAANPHAG